MISIETFRKLDPAFKDMSDVELEKTRQELYSLAELLFDMWKKQRDSKTSHLVVEQKEV